MIVILNRDVKGTGKAGDVVKVSDGYARNLLLPKGYATEATDGNIRSLEKQKKQSRRRRRPRKRRPRRRSREAQRSDRQDSDKSRRKRQGLRLHHLEGYRGKAEGTAQDYHRQEKILLDGPMKQTGTFSVDVKLYPEVSGKLTVEISAE